MIIASVPDLSVCIRFFYGHMLYGLRGDGLTQLLKCTSACTTVQTLVLRARMGSNCFSS